MFVRYALALGLALAALVATRLLASETDGPVYAVLVGAVAVATWFGGPGPGVLALAASWVLAPVVVYPGQGFGLTSGRDTVTWGVSLAVGVLIVWSTLILRIRQERATTAAVVAEASTRQMELLQELATALSSAVTPADVARELVERAPPAVGAQGSGIALVDSDELLLVELSGATRMRPERTRIPLRSTTLLGRAVLSNTMQRAFDRESIAARFPDTAAALPQIEAALAVPVRVGDDVAGALGFVFDSAGDADDEAESIAWIAAVLGGHALERARLYEHERQRRRALDRILRATPRFYAETAEDVSGAICEEARQTLEADLAAIWRLEEDRLVLVSSRPELESGKPEVSIDDFPGLRAAVAGAEPAFVSDLHQEARGHGRERASALGIHSSLRTPITVGGRADIVLIVSWRRVIPEPDAWMLAVARRFADQAGLAFEQLERREAEEEAAERARDTRRLLDVIAALAAAATPAEVTSALLREGLRSLGATAGVVVGRTEDSRDLKVLDAVGYQPETEPWREIPLDAPVPLAEAVRSDRLIAIETAEELEKRYPDFAATRTETTGSWLAVPLTAGSSVIGAVGFSFADERGFSEADLEFTHALGRQSGQALERALLLAAEYAARTLAEDMIILASALSQAVTPTDVVRAVGGQVLSMVEADLVGMYLLRFGSILELVGTAGDSPASGHGALQRLRLDGATPAAHAARTREPVWVESEEEWERHTHATSWRVAGIQSAAAVPLVVDGRVLGVLVVGSGQATTFDAPARQFVESAARQAAPPLERAWLMDREQAARIAAEAASARTRRLQSITQSLAAASTPKDVASVIVDEALAAVSGDAAAFVAERAGGEAPEALFARGLERSDLVDELRPALADASLTGELLVIASDSPDGPHASSARAALSGHGFRSAVCVPIGIGARVFGSLLVCFRARDRVAGEDSDLLQTVARIGAQAFERSRLFEEEQRLRVRSERLQRLTAALSRSLTPNDVAEAVVDAVVQGMRSDGAALSVLLEDRQMLRALAWHGYDDEVMESNLVVSLDSSIGATAIARRTTAFYRRADGEGPSELAERLRLMGHDSVVVVPLLAGSRASGIIVTSWKDAIALTPEDAGFLETLATQAAQALDRARHFESERTIAETLQRSVLPASLPHVEGVQLAARYLPGTEEVDVGGDWFDAILLPSGQLGLAVGDVVGKGVQAAATMAQLRNALRAFTIERMRPSSTLTRLNRLADEVSGSGFATVVYAVLDPETRVCRFTAAGHPPPLLVHPGGKAEFLEGGRGLPLGALPDATFRQQAVEIPVGSTLVLYTDGLIERRGEPIDDGLEKLRRAAAESHTEPERLVEHVLARVVGEGARGDDIAMLAVRPLVVAPNRLQLHLPSDPRSLDLVRDALRVWLQNVPGTQLEAHEVVLAAWEACANAVEHPQPRADSMFDLTAELLDSTVQVSVRDPGGWLPAAERPDRGLGLRLMRSVMSSVDIEVDDGGTVVRLQKELVDRVPVG